ncbi:HupE/UreJ family protein [Singulisphaera rosea]
MKVVTAITLAHSITLTLTALDLIRVPEWVVEPVIAGSIVFVAIQNLFRPDSSRGRSRLAAAFVLGLFHGMGFAGGLLDLLQGLPKPMILLAILGFSIGVEDIRCRGHIAFDHAPTDRFGDHLGGGVLLCLRDPLGHSLRIGPGKRQTSAAVRPFSGQLRRAARQGLHVA